MRFMLYALKKDRNTLALAGKALSRLHRACANKVLAEKLGVKCCSDANIIVAIGGDGTILSAAREHPGALIFGVHKGDVGFLTEIGESDLCKGLEAVVSGKYSIESRAKIAVHCSRKKLGEALNEIVIASARPAGIMELSIEIDGNMYGPFSADGVIVSTPTGSTAYAMSASGSVVDPSCKVLSIVPICPYTNGAKALVVPDSAKIRIKVLKGSGAIAIDGRVVRKLRKNEAIHIEKASSYARFIRLKRHFYRKINEMCR